MSVHTCVFARKTCPTILYTMLVIFRKGSDIKLLLSIMLRIKKIFYLFIARERERKGGREGEKH